MQLVGKTNYSQYGDSQYKDYRVPSWLDKPIITNIGIASNHYIKGYRNYQSCQSNRRELDKFQKSLSLDRLKF